VIGAGVASWDGSYRSASAAVANALCSAELMDRDFIGIAGVASQENGVPLAPNAPAMLIA
jgi:hypothetical protein